MGVIFKILVVGLINFKRVVSTFKFFLGFGQRKRIVLDRFEKLKDYSIIIRNRRIKSDFR